MAGEADKTLISSAFHCKKRNWTFDKYAFLHLKQHQILEGLILQYQYKIIDPGSKFVTLTQGSKPAS